MARTSFSSSALSNIVSSTFVTFETNHLRPSASNTIVSQRYLCVLWLFRWNWSPATLATGCTCRTLLRKCRLSASSSSLRMSMSRYWKLPSWHSLQLLPSLWLHRMKFQNRPSHACARQISAYQIYIHFPLYSPCFLSLGDLRGLHSFTTSRSCALNSPRYRLVPRHLPGEM